MVNIDSVYQKVLMIANKEQRGYITPQEFNLFADHAQKEIFEQYFYNLNQHQRAHGSSEEYSDMSHNINEKIAIFETTTTIIAGTINATILNNATGETDLYRLGTVISSSGLEVEEVQQNELLYINQSPLTKPTTSRPVYVRTGITTINKVPSIGSATCTYIRKPSAPSWGYYVNGNKALFDSSNNKTTNFELHAAEESELVYKILKLAGITLKNPEVVQVGQALEQGQVQQEKQ